MTHAERATANDRLKATWSHRFWTSMIVAIVGHFVLLQFWPSMQTEVFASPGAAMAMLDLPPVTDLPPPPERLQKPAIPVVSTADVADDVTIAPTTFRENPPDRLAPPPEAGSRDRGEPVAFIPYEVAPRILNPNEVEAALRREYPAVLRNAGIEGTVQVWFRIDADGRVVERRVQATSGHRQLDEAALAVADLMKFSPAMNRDTPVSVGVTFGIRFEVR